MAIGTSAHELGHGIGLPDLYDTSLETEGIGEWGLMGSGNYTSLASPAHYEAWSKHQMGWVTVRELTESGSYELGPVVLSDTVFLIRPVASNPRGEYFLLENKQAHGSDTSNMQTGGGTGPKIGGLLIWHIDSAKTAVWPASNTANSGAIHGVALEQADGQNHLRRTTSPKNRGDDGDPYPGSSTNLRYSFDTNPAAVTNHDGSFVGWEIDSVTQVEANGVMRFELRFGGATVVRATDTRAQVIVDGVRYNEFAQVLEDGSTHTIGIDSAQTTTDTLTQFIFDSWSDSGERTHDITGSLAGDTIIASVHLRLRVRATVSGNGTVSATPAGDLANGVHVRKDSTIALEAAPAAGHVFEEWTGDTTGTMNPLQLTVSKPYTVTANFLAQLLASVGALGGPVMGKAYSDTLAATGGTGSYSWQVVSGVLPEGLSLATDGVVSGIPAVTGSFSAGVRVTSGSQTADETLALTVTAPALARSAVVAQVLGTGLTLSADELRYLDLLGNRNGSFDVGDFLAWVQATGAPASALGPAAALLGQADGERRIRP